MRRVMIRRLNLRVRSLAYCGSVSLLLTKPVCAIHSLNADVENATCPNVSSVITTLT